MTQYSICYPNLLLPTLLQTSGSFYTKSTSSFRSNRFPKFTPNLLDSHQLKEIGTIYFSKKEIVSFCTKCRPISIFHLGLGRWLADWFSQSDSHFLGLGPGSRLRNFLLWISLSDRETLQREGFSFLYTMLSLMASLITCRHKVGGEEEVKRERTQVCSIDCSL